MTRARADAELRVLAERAAAALPATHEHLQSRVAAPGEVRDVTGLAQLALTNVPALLVLLIACMRVGTLVDARTATREGEIALRTALGASRGRIVGQLFVETLVLTSMAAAIGLIAADTTIRWAIGTLFSRAWRQAARGACRHPVSCRGPHRQRRPRRWPSSRLFVAASGNDVALYAGFLAATTGVMLVAAMLASIVPARRALRINPIEALREA